MQPGLGSCLLRQQAVARVTAAPRVHMHSPTRAAACTEPRCTVEGWRRPLTGGAAGPAAAQAPVVALGKFDALHKGHAALAIAAAHLGAPWLVSFSGMAEVLGWPARLPLVAPCDRPRVLRSWAAACGGQVPRECSIPFSEVRSMSPEAFVELLAAELHVAGVVVGSNYRFGYRAAGTAELLQQLGPQHGMQVRVLDLVGSHDHHHHHQEDRTVSSSRVRKGLSAGDLQQVEVCLGRPYRLACSLEGASLSEGPGGPGIRLCSDAYHNQPPGPGHYHVAASWCTAGASTLDCEREGWREARLGLDETGLTLALAGGGGAEAEGWARRGGVLVLDFRSAREEGPGAR